MAKSCLVWMAAGEKPTKLGKYWTAIDDEEPYVVDIFKYLGRHELCFRAPGRDFVLIDEWEPNRLFCFIPTPVHK